MSDFSLQIGIWMSLPCSLILWQWKIHKTLHHQVPRQSSHNNSLLLLSSLRLRLTQTSLTSLIAVIHTNQNSGGKNKATLDNSKKNGQTLLKFLLLIPFQKTLLLTRFYSK